MYYLTDFIPGQRIELHPATDAWMRGDRFGIVDSVTTRRVRVRFYRSGRVSGFRPQDILKILETPQR